MEQDDELQKQVQVHKLTEEIAEKLKEVEGASADLSIYRVPNKLRKVKEDAYNPRLVSIGPFHRSNTDLASMVEHKWRYLLYFVQRRKGTDLEDFESRFNQSFNCLEMCTVSLYNQNQKIRGCYAEEIDDDHGGKDKLMKLMLLDGCFILELFLRQEERWWKLKSKGKVDPIFNNAWMIPALQQDLALLENQIPFFVLKTLYEVIKPHISNFTPPVSVTRLALKFFLPMNQKALKAEDRDTKDCKHLLDLLHKLYLPQSLESCSIELPTDAIPAASGTSMNKGFSKGASQLLESGVQLQKGSPEDPLVQIIFYNGVLKIPPIFIKQTTDSLFRNFIAFEQCHLKGSHHITSYAIFMKSLIRSSEDVKILRERGIMKHNWIEDEEYMAQFTSILDEVVVRDFCFGKLCDSVNAYGRKFSFGKYLKSLYQIYFSAAWSLISFIAAVSLFALTITQTYYSIHPP